MSPTRDGSAGIWGVMPWAQTQKVEMTVDIELIYHAGDLVGYNKHGRALYLPGGGARDGEVTAGDDDDDIDDAVDEDEPDPPAQQPVATRPSYKQLVEENKKLRDGNTRNNQELAKRRRVAQWMKDHGIDDLDVWLAQQGIDRETGLPLEGTGNGTRSATEPPAAPPPAPHSPPASSGNGGPPGGVDPAEVQRLVQLELERRNAQADERAEKLTASLRSQAIEAGLTKAAFVGTVATAMKVIDLSKVAVDDDGNVTGVDDAVAALRTEIPEWFRRRPASPPPPPASGSVDGGDKGKPRPPKKKWEDQIVDRWQSGR